MQNSTKIKTEKNNSSKWLVLIAVGIGTFMSALDASVVNVTLPTITTAFKSQVSVTEWIVTIYLLTVSCLLLAFGRLGDLHGHKRVYSYGFVLFTFGSVLCGFSNSPLMLITFRGLQAFGAAMLFANSPAILTGNFPSSQRGQALGLQATLTYLGLMVGPSLGGWITQQFGWQAVFFINIPVGILGLVLCLRFIPQDGHPAAYEAFDKKGAVIFMIGLLSLLIALNRGENWGWITVKTLGLILFAIAILIWFVRWEKRTASPMLDIRLFRYKTFSFSALSALLNYISLYSIIFLLPFYLIHGRSFSPSKAGLILTAQPFVMAIIAPLSGWLSDRINPRWLTTSGMAILSIGLWQLAQLNSASSIQTIVIALATAGFGTGMFASPNNSVLMGAAPGNRQGIAAGILATARNVGMVLGVGMAGAIYTTLLMNNSSPASQSSNLFNAIHWSFLASVIVAIIGVLFSWLRANSDNQ